MPQYTSTTTTSTTGSPKPTVTVTTPLGITITPTTTKGTTTTPTTTKGTTTTKTTASQPTIIITNPKPTPYVHGGYGGGYTAPTTPPPLDFTQELAQKQAIVISQKIAEEQKQNYKESERLKDQKEMQRRALVEIKASDPASKWVFDQDNVSVTRTRESAIKEMERQQDELKAYEESIRPKTAFFGRIKTLVPSTTPRPFTHGATLTQEEPMLLAPKPPATFIGGHPPKEFFEDLNAQQRYNEFQQKGNWVGLIGAGFGSALTETGRFVSKIPEKPVESLTDLITGTLLFPITTVESAIKKGIPYTFGATGFYLGLGELTGKFGGKLGKLKETKLSELRLMENWKIWDQEFGTKFVSGYETKAKTEVSPYTRIYRKVPAKASGIKGIIGDLTKVEFTAPKGTKLTNIGETNIFAQDIQGITTVGKLKYMKTQSLFKGGSIEKMIGGTAIVSKKLMVSDIYPMKETRYTRKVSADILNPKEQLALFGQKVTARKGAMITERVDLFASKMPRAPKARGTGVKIGKTTLPKSRRTPLIFEKPIIELPKNWFKGRSEYSGSLGTILIESTMKKPSKRVLIETAFKRPKISGNRLKRTSFEKLLGRMPNLNRSPFYAPKSTEYPSLYKKFPSGNIFGKYPKAKGSGWGNLGNRYGNLSRFYGETPSTSKGRTKGEWRTRTGGGFRGIDIGITGRGKGKEKPREDIGDLLKPVINIGTGMKPTQKPAFRQSFRQQQRQSFKQFTDMITPQRYRPSTRPELIENPFKSTKPKAPRLPPEDEFTKMLTGGRKKQYKIRKKYSPSFTALEFGIRGKEPKILLGTEIRPIISKRRFRL